MDQTDAVARARELVAVAPEKRPSRIVAALKDAMVDSDGNAAKVDVEGSKVFALYYSASWCGPCRQFSPSLVKYVNEVAAANPKLTVVLVSSDEKDADMFKYMKEDKMPFMAVPMAKSPSVLLGYAKGSIPQLTIVDRYGKVLADSWNGQQYIGPKVALAGLDKLLKSGAGK
jgi:nucleoredoxin